MSSQSGSSHWIPVVSVGVITLVAWILGGLDSPILGDRAYFTYLSQEILRGERIYANSFMGYPPLGLMIQAFAMWIGLWFELPTYLAPRFAAPFVGAASAMLLCDVTRRATRNAWAGLVAGVVLVSFQRLSESALTVLEPKLLVIFFTLLSSAALQRKRWVAVGAASAAAASCWQPAVLVPLVLIPIVVATEDRRRADRLGRYIVGGLVGALPTLIYITLSDQSWEFWQRSVVFPASWSRGAETMHWLYEANTQLRSEVLFFWAAGVGFLAYGVEFFCRARSGLGEWFGVKEGGIPALTIAWVAFNTYEFQNAPDMFPILPCVGFWTGWLACRGTALAPAPATRFALPILAFAIALYGLADGARRNPTISLEEEVAMIRRITQPAGEHGTVMSFSAEAVYVISERRSPMRFLRLTDGFMPFLDLVEPGGCKGIMDRILSERYSVVVVRIWRHSSECERNIPAVLETAGYRRGTVSIGKLPWKVFLAPRLAPSALE